MTLIAYAIPSLGTAKHVVKQMSKTSCFRRSFNRQHGKQSQTLLNSERQHLYHNYCSLRKKLSRRTSLLVICKILRLILNTLTADDEYSLCKSENLPPQLKYNFLTNKKLFPNLLFHFWNLHQILKYFLFFVASLFVTLRTVKDVETNVWKAPFQNTVWNSAC